MSNEVKFGWLPGHRLAFTAYQPTGIGRGIPDQPLQEIRDTGLYLAEPLTALVDGDVALVNELETVTWEDDIVIYLSEESLVYWEGARVYYEGEWVADFDTTVNSLVTSKSNPIGIGEFTIESGEMSGMADDVEQLIEDGNIVTNVYDETAHPSEGVSVTSTGTLTQESGDC